MKYDKKILKIASPIKPVYMTKKEVVDQAKEIEPLRDFNITDQGNRFIFSYKTKNLIQSYNLLSTQAFYKPVEEFIHDNFDVVGQIYENLEHRDLYNEVFLGSMTPSCLPGDPHDNYYYGLATQEIKRMKKELCIGIVHNKGELNTYLNRYPYNINNITNKLAPDNQPVIDANGKGWLVFLKDISLGEIFPGTRLVEFWPMISINKNHNNKLQKDVNQFILENHNKIYNLIKDIEWDNPKFKFFNKLNDNMVRSLLLQKDIESPKFSSEDYFIIYSLLSMGLIGIVNDKSRFKTYLKDDKNNINKQLKHVTATDTNGRGSLVLLYRVL